MKFDSFYPLLLLLSVPLLCNSQPTRSALGVPGLAYWQNRADYDGIIRDEQGACRIHNRIFEQRLYGYFLAKQATEKAI